MASYTKEFRLEAVRLVQTGGRSMNSIADELGVCRSTLRGWVAKAVPKAPSSETPEQELQRLRKENRILQMERDILKKATAFFAKENR